MTELTWLAVLPDWRARLAGLAAHAAPLAEAVALAHGRSNFLLTNRLDASIRHVFPDGPMDGAPALRRVRLAVLGSSTLGHLLPAIRVAGLRHGLWIDTHEGDYGQAMQDLTDPGSALHAFAPTIVLVAFDTPHLTEALPPAADAAAADAALGETLERLSTLWRLARAHFKCAVIQQTLLPTRPLLLGSNEHRLPASRAGFAARLNHALRARADAEAVDLLALDERAALDGLAAWHSPVLWHHAKQEIVPTAAPLYGDLVARLIGARLGTSRKCLVIDLDNTIWGGVIGDDGLSGIVLGQGSPLGEAFVAFQQYIAELGHRGVILAVCSKNDEANAREPFAQHPEMVLREGQIAAFVANWTDKPANLRAIAAQLNIGLDALVFVDDNPFERELVRRELPEVAVPEMPEDPALYVRCLADAGYFESLAVTDEDRARTALYRDNAARGEMQASATDLPSYLRGLQMELCWSRFDAVGLQRTVQLINKSNQFNLTTTRYTDAEVRAVMDDPSALGLQLRLLDRFGDNGVIAILIGRMQGTDMRIDTWLMSCRVLGRQVEQASLNLLAAAARSMGARRLIGIYKPTAKNGMVRDHYAKLGFTPNTHEESGATRHVLSLDGFEPTEIFIHTTEG